jgi:hypothetical protein
MTDSREADLDPSEAGLEPTELEAKAAVSTPDRSASPPAYRGVCPRCETAVDTDTANDLVAFHRRHHRVTGHEVTVERAPLADGAAGADDADGTDSVDADDAPPTVVDIVRSRQADPETSRDSGVPVGAVAVVLNAHGVGIGETLTRIHDRRLTGVLYEPTDDHLRAL